MLGQASSGTSELPCPPPLGACFHPNWPLARVTPPICAAYDSCGSPDTQPNYTASDRSRRTVCAHAPRTSASRPTRLSPSRTASVRSAPCAENVCREASTYSPPSVSTSPLRRASSANSARERATHPPRQWRAATPRSPRRRRCRRYRRSCRRSVRRSCRLALSRSGSKPPLSSVSALASASASSLSVARDAPEPPRAPRRRFTATTPPARPLPPRAGPASPHRPHSCFTGLLLRESGRPDVRQVGLLQHSLPRQARRLLLAIQSVVNHLIESYGYGNTIGHDGVMPTTAAERSREGDQPPTEGRWDGISSTRYWTIVALCTPRRGVTPAAVVGSVAPGGGRASRG